MGSVRVIRRDARFFRPVLVELERRIVPGFLATRAFDTGSSPESVAVGDFNGDGHLDLAVADYGNSGGYGQGVSVLLGNGDGSFQAQRAFAAGSRPRAVAVGDFTGDGLLDLAVVGGYTGVSVLLGNGDGSFQAPHSFPAGGASRSVAVADFNGDGVLDLAVANDYSNTVSVLLGNGDGSFQAPRSYSVGNTPRSVAVGDFTGDGVLDLAVANYNSGNVSVLLGNGDGSFQAAQTYATGFDPTAVAVGSFTGDSMADLAVTNAGNGTVSVLLGNGDGSFQPARTFGAGPDPQSLAVGDFNSDGLADLAVSNNINGNVSVLLGNGDGSFQNPQSFAAGTTPIVGLGAVAVGDFTSDGPLDLAVTIPGGVSVLLGNGDGTLQGTNNVAAGSGPQSVAVGDFNGDGVPDLAVADFGRTVAVLLGNGDGSFQPAQTFAVGLGAKSVAVGDFNGDGHLDLAVADYGSYFQPGSTVSVLLGNGDGTFQPAQDFATGGRPAAVTVGDFNGDGHPDLAVANVASYPPGTNGSVRVLVGNGDGTFQAPRTAATGFDPHSVAVGDFNGDGHLDLAATDAHGINVRVLLGNGDGSFQAAQSFATGGMGPDAVTVEDFNGDGHPDLAVANAGTYPSYPDGSVGVLLGNGDGSFQPAQTFAAGTDPVAVAVGDVNVDGVPDLAVVGAGGVRVLLGNGDGSLQTTSFSYVAGGSPQAVAMGDFNGDGWPDLAVANNFSNDVSILLNDRLWPRRNSATRSPLPTAQPISGGVAEVQPPPGVGPGAGVPEAALATAAIDLPPADGPVAGPLPAPLPPAITERERFVAPSAPSDPAERSPRTHVRTAAQPALLILDLGFADTLAPGFDGRLLDDRSPLPA